VCWIYHIDRLGYDLGYLTEGGMLKVLRLSSMDGGQRNYVRRRFCGVQMTGMPLCGRRLEESVSAQLTQ